MSMFPLLSRYVIWQALCLCALSFLPQLAAAEAAIEKGSAEEKAAGITWTFTPDPKLPDVLILGDSISIGYLPHVRTSLKGIANVFRPVSATTKKPINCGDSGHGLDLLDTWLAERSWRVIHFNFGLHDLKYLDEKGRYVTPDHGKQVNLLPAYTANLTHIVERLKKTGAKLIWASTTPVPDGSPGRVKGDEVAYNAAARDVMQANGVAIDDLCDAISKNIISWQAPHNVHFTNEGSQVLARSVTTSIQQALNTP